MRILCQQLHFLEQIHVQIDSNISPPYTAAMAAVCSKPSDRKKMRESQTGRHMAKRISQGGCVNGLPLEITCDIPHAVHNTNGLPKLSYSYAVM